MSTSQSPQPTPDFSERSLIKTAFLAAIKAHNVDLSDIVKPLCEGLTAFKYKWGVDATRGKPAMIPTEEPDRRERRECAKVLIDLVGGIQSSRKDREDEVNKTQSLLTTALLVERGWTLAEITQYVESGLIPIGKKIIV